MHLPRCTVPLQLLRPRLVVTRYQLPESWWPASARLRGGGDEAKWSRAAAAR
jgi:hypothetical protein